MCIFIHTQISISFRLFFFKATHSEFSSPLSLILNTLEQYELSWKMLENFHHAEKSTPENPHQYISVVGNDILACIITRRCRFLLENRTNLRQVSSGIFRLSAEFYQSHMNPRSIKSFPASLHNFCCSLAGG